MSILKTLSIATTVLPTMVLAIAEPGLAATLNVFEPDAIVRGRTQAEWSAKWWQYVLSVPSEQSPVLDETGANANNGQSGPVYFLTGSFGTDPVERTIIVPNNKPIFFPLFNQVNINVPELTGKYETAEELRDQIDDSIEAVDTLSANVDGVDVPNLFDYRQKSPVFSVTLLDRNIIGLEAGTYSPAVSDGYWVMLAPLPRGNYEVNFGGADTATDGFSQDIGYSITSVPEPSSALGTLALGAFGAGWMLKRKLKVQSKAKSLV